MRKIHVATLERDVRPGFSTRNIGPSNLGAGDDGVDDGMALDPFVNLDDFTMDRPTFPPHPHAGFSAVTYMFEDSPGSFTNRWSKGDGRQQDIIGPGAFHWTQAGSGMMHEEVPIKPGVVCHGLQMFVKLPSHLELTEPQAFHADPHDVPVVVEDDAGRVRVRVLAGSYGGRTCAKELRGIGNAGLTFLDVHLDPGATFTVPVPKSQTAFVFTIRGSLTPLGASSTGNGDGDGDDDDDEATAAVTPLPPHAGVVFANDGGAVSVTTSSSGMGAQFVFGAGIPNGEPLVSSGPFMMSTAERIAEARQSYSSGAMGRLLPSF